jgi:hypothetical protein
LDRLGGLNQEIALLFIFPRMQILRHDVGHIVLGSQPLFGN